MENTVKLLRSFFHLDSPIINFNNYFKGSNIQDALEQKIILNTNLYNKFITLMKVIFKTVYKILEHY